MDKFRRPQCMDPAPPCEPHGNEIAMQRLWDKVKATFAEKDDVLAIVKELQKVANRPTVMAVQTGEDGPVQPVGSDGIAHLEYENWVESEGLDASGKPVHVYNDSKNALTAAAAAMVIKQVRHDVSRLKNFEIVVCDLGDDGVPSVPSVDFNTLYITPSGDDENGFTWTEWIYVKKNPNDAELNPHFERVGAKEIDLTWVKNDIAKLNADIKKTNDLIIAFSDKVADAILNRAVKPLEELQAYLKSPEFTAYIFEQLPRAAMDTDGLMTSAQANTLMWIALWVQNDYKVPGGGSLGGDYVAKLLTEAGMPEANEILANLDI